MLAIHTATQPSQFSSLSCSQCSAWWQNFDCFAPAATRRIGRVGSPLSETQGDDPFTSRKTWCMSMLLCLLNFNVDRLCRRHTKCLIAFNEPSVPIDVPKWFLGVLSQFKPKSIYRSRRESAAKQDMWPVHIQVQLWCVIWNILSIAIPCNPQKDRTCFQFPGWYRKSLPYYQVLFFSYFFYTLLICSIYWSFVDIYWHCICLPVLGMSDTALVIGSSSSPSDSLSCRPNSLCSTLN